MSISRKVIAGAVVTMLALSLVPPAAADSISRRDPKDTQGRLDIRRISHGHRGDDAFVHTISTYRRFPSKLLRPSGRAGGVFLLWLADDPSFDGTLRIVLVRWRNGRLRAPIFDFWTDRRVGTARVTRPNRRTIRIVIPKRALGTLGEHPGYYWAATSVYWDRGACSEDGCWDGAPNRRAVRHFIPEETPPEEPPPDVTDATASMDQLRELATSWMSGRPGR
jgi:hypothetical protein